MSDLRQVRVRCPRCGDCRIDAADVSLIVPTPGQGLTISPRVVFSCPRCSLATWQTVRWQITVALEELGAHATVRPAEVDERPSGAPFTQIDLVRWDALISDDTALRAAVDRISQESA